MSNRSLKEQAALNLLWKLKRTIDKKNRLHHEVENPEKRFKSTIDFASLLKDEDYRKFIIDEHINDTDGRIKQTAIELKALDISGEINLSKTKQDTTRPQASSSKPTEFLKKNPLSLFFQRSLPFIVSIAVTGILALILNNMFLSTPKRITITESITSDTTWHAENIYQLDRVIFVQNGAALTIEAGTQITGKEGSALIVTKQSQLFARGKKSKPIVFTSANSVGKKQPGDWGGIVLLGDAPVNDTTSNHIEGILSTDIRGSFGGNNHENSCGVLKYVRIEYAGYEIGAKNELNGLTLGGCGEGTLIDYVQMHQSYDDGLEIFGGSANIKHIVISQSGDDGLDWDNGWTGKGQFIFIQKTHDSGNSAIEADNNINNHNADPRSAPTLANITLLGSGKAKTQQQGILLRRGSIIHLRNSIIEGFAAGAFAIQDAETARAFEAHATLQGTVIASKSGLPLFTDHGLTTQIQAQSILQQPAHALQLLERSAFNAAAYEYTMPLPIIRDAAIASATFEHDKDTFFTNDADYVGAFDPSASKTWMNSWTHFR